MPEEGNKPTPKLVWRSGFSADIQLFLLGDKFASIGNVRGIGLVWGIELVMEKTTKESVAHATKEIVLDCVPNGLMAGELGIYGNVMCSPRRPGSRAGKSTALLLFWKKSPPHSETGAYSRVAP
jgi:hypothetical protein